MTGDVCLVAENPSPYFARVLTHNPDLSSLQNASDVAGEYFFQIVAVVVVVAVYVSASDGAAAAVDNCLSSPGVGVIQGTSADVDAAAGGAFVTGVTETLLSDANDPTMSQCVVS